jgi:hypothetical protein
LQLYRVASLGYQTICNVLKVLSNTCNILVPHYTTIRLWIIRAGYHFLQQPIEKAPDWAIIGDITIDIGKIKCLALLGVRLNELENRGNYTLSHNDVVLLDLHPTEKSTGEFNYNSFKETQERVEVDFKQIVIDQGSDIKNGASLFVKENSETKVIHDISHKLSLIIEHELKEDPEWLSYTKKLTETGRYIAQTELVALKPPTQRSKARFMDIGYLVRWPRNILELKKTGRLAFISEERYQKYFGWIKEETLIMDMLEFMVGVVDLVKDLVRTFGLSVEILNEIRFFFETTDAATTDRLKRFVEKVIYTVDEECKKLEPGEVVLASTEVLESIFGKFKAIINSGHQGITSNILGMATIIGKERSKMEIQQSMEQCSVKTVMGWIKGKIGTTVGSYRNKLFKGTKFDRNQDETVSA